MIVYCYYLQLKYCTDRSSSWRYRELWKPRCSHWTYGNSNWAYVLLDLNFTPPLSVIGVLGTQKQRQWRNFYDPTLEIKVVNICSLYSLSLSRQWVGICSRSRWSPANTQEPDLCPKQCKAAIWGDKLISVTDARNLMPLALSSFLYQTKNCSSYQNYIPTAVI